ncbi:MAG: shikimate kinase [Deltaproteobacteria bacterium]|nr:shikimate kinase [Deltaproteobacteria bacterium]MCL5792815.1 shikimate kinase [Deltaproteobacteria bacterium]
MEHIILVGMMGSGKTTIGNLVAKKSGRNFMDTDTIIEQEDAMSISDIMVLRGESYFRALERRIILSIGVTKPFVISTGGGAVMDYDIFNFLKKLGKVVYLKASPETLYRRVANTENRPLLRNGDRLLTIRKLLQEREGRYLESDIVIETDNRSHDEIADEIIKKVL